MNSLKNEHIVKLGEVEILLRPDFHNIDSLETNVGTISYLTYKYSRGSKGTAIEKVKALPPISEVAQIIYYTQASRNDDGTYKYSLEQVWDMVSGEGMNLPLLTSILTFLGKVTRGNKHSKPEDAPEEKKILPQQETTT